MSQALLRDVSPITANICATWHRRLDVDFDYPRWQIVGIDRLPPLQPAPPAAPSARDLRIVRLDVLPATRSTRNRRAIRRSPGQPHGAAEPDAQFGQRRRLWRRANPAIPQPARLYPRRRCRVRRHATRRCRRLRRRPTHLPGHHPEPKPNRKPRRMAQRAHEKPGWHLCNGPAERNLAGKRLVHQCRRRHPGDFRIARKIGLHHLVPPRADRHRALGRGTEKARPQRARWRTAQPAQILRDLEGNRARPIAALGRSRSRCRLRPPRLPPPRRAPAHQRRRPGT